jgi:outer membrane immunogenic protein
MQLKYTSLLQAIRLQASRLRPISVAASLLLAFAPSLAAQIVHQSSETAPFELTIGYSFLHANAPAGMCGCFSMNGGVGTFAYNAPHGLALAADISGGHSNTISGTPQSISLITYLAGPRFNWQLGSSRYTPYGQVLIGESTELSNYAFAQSVNGFAFMPGGGVKIRLSPHIGVNVEADWLHSDIPNNSNNRQNDIRVSTGLIFRFGGRPTR